MDKRMQLIDPDARQELTVDGVTFEIRSVNGILKSDLVTAFRRMDDGAVIAAASSLLPVMSKIITGFKDWPDKTSREVLEGISEGGLIALIFQKVTRAAMLSDNESKNSDSSLGSPSTISTRTADDATEKSEDASDTDNEL